MARYPRATWRGPIPNQSPGIGQVRLGVMHIMEGTLSGTDSWFHNAGAQASAHFGVGKSGTVYQWVEAGGPGSGDTAWHCANYNSVAIGIEHEGWTGESLTTAQLEADAGIVSWLAGIGAVPIIGAGSPAYSGWLTHGSLGSAGGNHPDCPGAPIAAQIPTILAMAISGGPTPPPQPEQEPSMWLLQDPQSDGYWQLANDGGVFAYDGAPYLGNTMKYNPAGWPVCGIALWEDRHGSGYCVTLDAGTSGGDRFRRYRFPRDGSAA